MAAAPSKQIRLEDLPPGLKLRLRDPAALSDPRAQALLADLLERARENPLLRYYPHGKQKPFCRYPRKIKVFLGGERSGKSVAGLLDNTIQAVDEEILPEHLKPYKIWQPPFSCRILTPDFGQSYNEILNTLQEWVPPAQLFQGDWENAFSEKNHKLRFANGSFFEFMTYEQDIGKFGGTSRHRVHYDEEPKGYKGEKIREANVNRLIEWRGDEIFTFSPVHGLGWTYDELWENRGEEIEKDVFLSDGMVLVRADQDDNPHLDQIGKEEAEAKIPAAMRDARKSGIFTHAEGLVYPNFDREIHVIDERLVAKKFLRSLDEYDGIDPGVITTAVLLAGFDSDNILWIYDELYLSGVDAIPENAAKLLGERRTGLWKLPKRPKRTLMDPNSVGRSMQTGIRTDKAYRIAGLKVKAARKDDREPGIFEVLRRMENRDDEDNPVPLIKISSRCKTLLWEIGRYRIEAKEDGSFDVAKRDDHGVDVMRYLCLERPIAPRRRRSKRKRESWIPGTAPPMDKKTPHRGYGPMGKYT